MRWPPSTLHLVDICASLQVFYDHDFNNAKAFYFLVGDNNYQLLTIMH